MVPAMHGCCTTAHYDNGVKESDMMATLFLLSKHICLLCTTRYQTDMDT